ncbi:S9 family peptidase [Streptomyces chartreusis]
MARSLHIEDLSKTAIPEQPALSPDGGQVVYVLRTVDRTRDRDIRSLWRVSVGGGEARRLTSGPADRAPAYSPDGKRIAFLRAENGPPQVWSLPADGGDPEQLTTLPLGAGTPVWSPDGTRLAFTALVDLTDEMPLELPMGAEAVDGEQARARTGGGNAPVVADRLTYQADGTELSSTLRRHIHVFDPATGTTLQLSSGDWDAGDPAWSPDGTRLAFTAAMTPDADLTVTSAAYVIEVEAQPAEPRLVGPVDGSIAALSWSVDGRALLVVGSLGGPSQPAGLLRVLLDGEPPIELTTALDRSVMPGEPAYPGGLPQQSGDGRTVLFCIRDGGCTHLYAVDADCETPRLVLGGAGRSVYGLSVARDGRTAAVVLVTSASFGEIAVIDLSGGTEVVLTAHGAALADVAFLTHTERVFTISDGTTVHGLLLRDPTVAGPQPLLLDIHGGPHNAWSSAADPEFAYHQILAGLGWTILLLNPRGSDGYGEQFFTATRGAWGEADKRDLLEPLDQLIAEGVADPRRLAVSGYSYGGFMTCYLTSRDDRFAAAVAGGAITDLTSMVGTSDAGRLLSVHELGAEPWADRERYRDLSPLSRVEHVTTPTLILHGAADMRCPVGQAQQWHTALRERGVPARLVLYPGGSHLFPIDGHPSHREDYNRRIVDWVRRHTGDPSPAISACASGYAE